MRTGQSFTTYGWILLTWILLTPFQYGYHISVLNQIQSVLTCKVAQKPKSLSSVSYSLPDCIPMSEFTFSVVTSIFTLGGLVGSLSANVVMERYGRKGATRVSAIFVTLGTALMGVSGGVFTLAFGRFLVGIGSGVGLCVGPIYLSEIAPAKISGTVGVLTQLGIVMGIFITQLIGLKFASPETWRIVIVFSTILGIVQWAASGIMVDTPGWTSGRPAAGGKDAAAAIEMRIWGNSPSASIEAGNTSSTSSIFETGSAGSDDEDATANHPLLSEPVSGNVAHAQGANANVTPINLPTLLLHTPMDVRRPMIIVCCAMLGQQVSGINAILYYSNNILSKSLPELGPYVSLGVATVNVIMTFPPIFLVEKLGRRQLLTISTLGALASLCTVGIALDTGFTTLASAGIIIFVMSFAVGLGPIPFIMIPEVSPFYAVSALSSLALSINWTANFFVGLIFLPLRNLLSGKEADKEGRVFWVFAVALLAVMSVVRSLYRG